MDKMIRFAKLSSSRAGYLFYVLLFLLGSVDVTAQWIPVSPPTLVIGINSYVINFDDGNTYLRETFAFDLGTVVSAVPNGTGYDIIVNPSSSGVGTITITAKSGFVSSYSVLVSSFGVFDIGSVGQYCSSPGNNITLTLSGSQVGVNYEVFRSSVLRATTAGTGGALSWSVPSGTYSIKGTEVSSGINGFMRGQNGTANYVITDPLPLTTFSMGSNTVYCSGSSATVSLLGSELGSNYLVSYQLYLNGTAVGTPVNGTGGQINWTGITSAGSYTIIATNTQTGCTKTMLGTTGVTSNPLPNDFAVSGTGLTCAATPILTMAGSQVGVNYTLMNIGNPQQTAQAGTGAAMNWTLSRAIFTPYTINAVDASTGCARTMSGSATVIAPSYPQDFTVSGGGTMCSGDPGFPIYLSSSQNGASYQLLRDGVPVGSPLTGVSVQLTWPNQTVPGVYTVRASRSGNCDAIMSGSATIIVNPLPTIFTISGGGGYCAGSSTSVTLNNSELGVAYQLKLPNGTFGSILSGNNGPGLTWTNQTMAGTYGVMATNASTGCQQLMTVGAGFTPVFVKPQPTILITPATLTICSGSATIYVISNPNNLAGTTLAWTQSATNVTGAANGAGSSINQILTNSTTGNGTVTYTATATTSGCTATTTATTTVKPVPAVTGGSTTIFSGAPLNFTATSSLSPATFNWTSAVTSGTASNVSASGSGAITDSPQNKGLQNAVIAYHITAVVNGCTSTPQDYVVTVTDQNINYLRQNTLQVSGITSPSQVNSLPAASVVRSVSYFDGLGRPTQSVATQGSPLQQDIVTPAVYDGFGREYRKYLPVVLENGGRYKNNLLDASNQYTTTFYNGGAAKVAADVPYSETKFEFSPLNRVLKQGAPGAVWQPNNTPTDFSDKTIKKVYDVNAASEVYLFNYNATTGLVSLSAGALAYYGAGQLTMLKTLDETNNEVIEYKDKLGHTICKKVQYGTNAGVKQYASTYYVYDDLGNLVVVIPPEGAKIFGIQ
ncbi:MAG: DUF6443 domain-containing protein [Cyclobacteriaceae bacterium]